MKTFLSIPLILLILFTGISVNFSTHYCHGSVAATKISLKGEIATCGMESGSAVTAAAISLNKHCCDDISSSYSICNIFYSSTYAMEYPCQKVTSIIDVEINSVSNQAIINITSNEIIKPPGDTYINSITCPVLCVFRI